MLASGNLRERISFKRPIRTQNNSGGFDTSFGTPYLSSYSEAEQLTPSNELIVSKADIIQAYKFKIRYRTDHVIQIGDVIEYRNRDFEILSFENDPLRTRIVIVTKTSRNGSI